MAIGSVLLQQTDRTQTTRQVILADFGFFYDTRGLVARSAAKAWEKTCDSMRARESVGKDGEGFFSRNMNFFRDNPSNIRTFIALAPLAKGQEEYYLLIHTMICRLNVAGRAAEGDSNSINLMKEKMASLKPHRQAEMDAFAKSFQTFFSVTEFSKSNSLLRTNTPISGAKEQFEKLETVAKIYIATPGKHFAGINGFDLLSEGTASKAVQVQEIAKREGIPIDNVWLLERSYNQQVVEELRKIDFHNVVVVEINPDLSPWNYKEAMEDRLQLGFRVLPLKHLASDLPILSIK